MRPIDHYKRIQSGRVLHGICWDKNVIEYSDWNWNQDKSHYTALPVIDPVLWNSSNKRNSICLCPHYVCCMPKNTIVNMFTDSFAHLLFITCFYIYLRNLIVFCYAGAFFSVFFFLQIFLVKSWLVIRVIELKHVWKDYGNWVP